MTYESDVSLNRGCRVPYLIAFLSMPRTKKIVLVKCFAYKKVRSKKPKLVIIRKKKDTNKVYCF